ncbi:ATP-grasp domain-containing protein [Vagococcus coleopterorum]|uniref:ATP-grasp domain-containing protein n=1 Tax=Vagococcus coleopterorum TaxID=2714946 RepID=A0A6G8APR3_9ENTE|nr:ATP-grasp domain-containing protein [Vagococcus coleopterorum]QIL46932.1 ATP-grasp domain-containing protein [Vagococcus coleopterorum]
MANLFIPGHTVGIVGGGYQGRMLAMAAKNMGFRVSILDPNKQCAAADIADVHVLAATTDESGLISLAEKSDVLTFACNSINIEAVKSLKNHIAIPQNIELLELAQNRLLAKKYFEESNINITPYEVIGESADLDLAIESIGLPAVLKPVEQQDGKKQSFFINSLMDIRNSLELLASGPCLLESQVDYKRAIAVSVVGNSTGNYQVMPIVEISPDPTGRFHRGIVPARIHDEVAAEVNRIAEEMALSFKVQGVLTVEMFITEFGVIYVNSLNHGPHDSGDYSLNLGVLSQYEAHLRGLFFWPIPAQKLLSSGITLPIQQKQLVDSISMIPFHENWFYHFDGVMSHKPEEIVGHLTVVTEDVTESLKEIEQTNIWEDIFPA